MSNTYIIGGIGVVGSAMVRAFKDSKIIDAAKPGTLSLYADMRDGDIAFICVPTLHDSARGGYQYDAVDDVLDRLPVGVVPCLRSTVTPEFFDCVDRVIVYHPEFLRADHADEDFRAQKMRVYGVHPHDSPFAHDYVSIVEHEYAEASIVAACVRMHPCEAALLKLYHNAWCAVNVALANEFAALHEACMGPGAHWDTLRGHLIHLLDVNGKTFDAYSRVPGPDGRRGFGGACFPKDTAALSDVMRRHDLPRGVIDGALATNAKVRG